MVGQIIDVWVDPSRALACRVNCLDEGYETELQVRWRILTAQRFESLADALDLAEQFRRAYVTPGLKSA